MNVRDRKTVLENWHPIPLFCLLMGILLWGMLAVDPVVGGLAEGGSLVFLCLVEPWPRFGRRLGWNGLLIVLLTVTNPFFSHNGMTPLFFVNGQAYTLEAVLYGLHIGLMMAATLNWCHVLSLCMDNDKLLYLTSHVTPALGLLLTMALRLVPMMRKKFREMRDVDIMLDEAVRRGRFASVLRYLTLFLAVAGWAFERVPRMATSMNARGYGSGRRTSFSPLRFRKRDAVAWLAVLLLVVGLWMFYRMAVTPMLYYPSVQLAWTMESKLFYVGMAGLFMFPAVREGVDRWQWKYWKSKM